MDVPESWPNLKHFRSMVQVAKETHEGERQLRVAMIHYMGSCPLELLVKSANLLADFREQELRDHTANN